MKFLRNLLLFFLVGCTGHQENDVPTRIEIDQVAVEQQIPKSVMAQLDEDFKEEFKTTPPLYAFIPLTVAFKEIQPGVLNTPFLEYAYPKGGGQLDLKEVLKGEGSFYMYFPTEQFDKENDLLHIFFISNSPRVSIDGENFGLGCGKWNDLKSGFKKLQKIDNLKLNTTDLRYLRVIAGTYIFVFKQNKNIYLTQLTITDSRFANQLCVGGTK
jgi:hypothetical protein